MMLRLKDLLEVIDENTLCKITDINGKRLWEVLSVNDFSINAVNYLEYHILLCYVVNNRLDIVLDIDIRT